MSIDKWLIEHLCDELVVWGVWMRRRGWFPLGYTAVEMFIEGRRTNQSKLMTSFDSEKETGTFVSYITLHCWTHEQGCDLFSHCPDFLIWKLHRSIVGGVSGKRQPPACAHHLSIWVERQNQDFNRRKSHARLWSTWNKNVDVMGSILSRAPCVYPFTRHTSVVKGIIKRTTNVVCSLFQLPYVFTLEHLLNLQEIVLTQGERNSSWFISVL